MTVRQRNVCEGPYRIKRTIGPEGETVLKQDFPGDFQHIVAITYRFSSRWRRVRDPQTEHDVTDKLTTTEFAAAILAACGWTGQKVGDHRNISSEPSSTIFPRHRQDLGQYMLH